MNDITEIMRERDNLRAEVERLKMEYKGAEANFAMAVDRGQKAEQRAERAEETIEQMENIHQDIMENGPRCTCGEGDEWCKRCGKSIKLSALAHRAIAAALDAAKGGAK